MVTELFGDAARLPPDPLLERLRGATVGSYDVVGELGRGGMAVVYAGTDRQLQRRVAIKVMDPRLSMTPGMAARFLQEARIAARLQHPNIIVVHDVRQSDEIIFFVMSLIDGVAVDEVCRQPEPIPIDQIRWILFQATRALAYAHSEDIVHRDIKPANILLNLKGDVILTDFGIAKALGDTGLTQSGTQVGTPMYMSPEQFSGVPVGPASDQYALGVTAYQMIAGRPPFTGDLYQLISAHGGKAPVPLRELRPDCPAFLANAVMRMLEKEPEDRWPSLEDLQDVFGANMAMDGGVARRKLGETVRALRGTVAGGFGATSGATSGPTSDAARATRSGGDRSTESMVVTISPPGATIFVSGTLELRASVALDTGQSLPGAGVQWISSDESVLVVQPNGTVSGVSPGTAVVRAAVNGGWSEATIRVEAAPIARLSLTTPHVTLRVGDVMRPEVIAVDVNGASCEGVSMAWISRSPAVADLDAPGVIRAISPGMAVIDVTTGNVRRSMDVAVLRRPIANLRLSAPARTLQLGDASTLSIEAFDDLGARTDATPARWTSSAPSVIHVDSTGRALAIGPGVARVSASVDEASDSLELESLEPAIGSVQLTLPDDHVELGDEVTWSLRVKDVNGASRSTSGVRVWSSAPHILQVDDTGQRARALHIGEAVIHAAPEDGTGSESAATAIRVVVTDVIVARVELFPAALDLEVGAVAAVNLQGLDRRGVPVMNPRAMWESDTPDVAVVEGNGIVRAMAPGACTIRARITNADATASDSALAVRVRAASIARLSITADRTMLEVGESMTLRATTWDAMDVEVRDAAPVWRSMHPAVARVEGDGRIVALSPGRATITAELEGKSGQITMLVAPAAVESLSITVPSTDAVVGTPLHLAIVAQDRNGHAVTPPVRWQVEPADAATITAQGDLTPLRAGAMTVRASLVVPADASGLLSAKSALEASATVRARAPRIASLQFGAPSVSLVVGRSLRADVRAKTDDGTTPPASALAWSSEHPDIVRVEANGELYAVAPGETLVTASADALRASMTVRVTVAGAARRNRMPLAVAGGAVGVAALVWALFWPSGTSTTSTDETATAVNPSNTPADVRADSVIVAAPPAADSGRVARVDSAPSAIPDDDGVEPSRQSPPASGRTAVTTPVPSPTARRNATDRPSMPPTATTSPSRVPVARANPAADSAMPTTRVTAPTPVGPPAYTPPVAAPPTAPVVETPVSRPPAPTAAAVEIPTASELRAIAERIAGDVRSGKLRSSAELRKFFDDGAEHKVAVGSSPAVVSPEQGQIRTQFELTLSRYNSGGALERRISVVRIDVAKRGGVTELLASSFGPIVRPGSR